MALIDKDEAVDLVRRMQTYKLSADANFLLVDQAEVMTELMLLPPAQPEPLTDAEQRIFIEAMWREKDVCMAVDKEFPDAKVNLTDVCREIVRKVKGVLWT